MPGITAGSFDVPDETRTPAKTTIDIVRLGAVSAARIRFEPGWTWAGCIKPVVGRQSCQARHVGVITAGRLHVVHEDGSESDARPGSVYVIEPGHDAWVVGDEPLEGYESASAETYARAEHRAS
jgi:hypothetical protein